MSALGPAAIVLVGTLTGLHAATWGAFKDSPFEGFRVSKFLRSVVLGLTAAYAVHRLLGVIEVLVLVGLAYSAERLVTEWWKAILREDRQDAYTIPMRLAVHGRPVDNPARRYAAGAAILVGLAVALVVANGEQHRTAALPVAGLVLLGGVGGWLTAIGGAWKDAPIEGFETLKFFRSPVVATAWAWLLAPFTSNLAVLAIAAAGWSVISIETYKTFLAGGPPGKFGDKPARFRAEGVRRACRALHGGVYAALTGWLALTVFAATLPGVEAEPSRVRAELVVLLLGAAFGMVVLTTRAPRPAAQELQDVS